MTNTVLSWTLTLAIVLIPAVKAPGIIQFGDTENTTAPVNGAPWSYVADLGVNNASAVYLGNGWLLTANHVGVPDDNIRINGTVYNRDISFAPLQIKTATDSVDMKLLRITGDPGLPKLPLAILGVDNDLNAAATIIGWGVGKGASTPGGWAWGDDDTRAQRWGTNRTISTPFGVSSSPEYPYNYSGLQIALNSNKGDNECGLTLGDSGAGLFVSISGVWKLCGAGTQAANPSLFSIFDIHKNTLVRVSAYADLLRFENWKQKHLGDSAAPDLGDSNADGIPHLTEYALGLDPHAAASSQPTVGYENGETTITYTKLMSATDVRISVEESVDLIDWEPATIASQNIVNSDGVVWTITDRVAAGAGSAKFLRLAITKL